MCGVDTSHTESGIARLIPRWVPQAGGRRLERQWSACVLPYASGDWKAAAPHLRYVSSRLSSTTVDPPGRARRTGGHEGWCRGSEADDAATGSAEIVVARFGGRVVEAELDEENGRPIWEMKLVGDDVAEADVDATNSAILR